jgi:hypothetical protein
MGGFLRNPQMAMQLGRYGAGAMKNAQAAGDRAAYNEALTAIDAGQARPDRVDPAIWDAAQNDREAARGARLQNDSKALGNRKDAFAESFIHAFHSNDPAPLMKTLSDHNSKFTFRTVQTGDGKYRIERAEDGTQDWKAMPLMGKQQVGLKDIFSYFDDKVYGKKGGVVEHVKALEKSGTLNPATLYKTAGGQWRGLTHGGDEYQGAIDPGQVPVGTAVANNPNKYGIVSLGDKLQPYGQNQMTGEVTPRGQAMPIGARHGGGSSAGGMGLKEHMSALYKVAEQQAAVQTADGKTITDPDTASFIGRLGQAFLLNRLAPDGYSAGWQAARIDQGINQKVEDGVAAALSSNNPATVFLNAGVRDEHGYRQVLRNQYRQQAIQGGFQQFLPQSNGYRLDQASLAAVTGGGRQATSNQPAGRVQHNGQWGEWHEGEFYPEATDPEGAMADAPDHRGITEQLRDYQNSPEYHQAAIPNLFTSGNGGFRRGQAQNDASLRRSFLRTSPAGAMHGPTGPQ